MFSPQETELGQMLVHISGKQRKSDFWLAHLLCRQESEGVSFTSARYFSMASLFLSAPRDSHHKENSLGCSYLREMQGKPFELCWQASDWSIPSSNSVRCRYWSSGPCLARCGRRALPRNLGPSQSHRLPAGSSCSLLPQSHTGLRWHKSHKSNGSSLHKVLTHNCLTVSHLRLN